MIKSFDVLLPVDFPYALVSFLFYFENYGTHTMNLYHAAGMNLIYDQVRKCYLFPQMECYRLSNLQNTKEPHDKKYELILMKGIFDDSRKVEAVIEIENQDLLDRLELAHGCNGKRLGLPEIPESGDDVVIADGGNAALLHHFSCIELCPGLREEGGPVLRLLYLESCTDMLTIVNAWLDDKHKLSSLR